MSGECPQWVESRRSEDYAGKMKFAAKIALALCVVDALGSGAALANAPEADSWESPPPANLHDCTNIDESLIVPVPMAHRSEAIARLKNVAVIELTQPELVALLNLPQGTPRSGADQVRNAIEQLKEQRREELENRHGSWSVYDQQRLDDLSRIINDPSTSDLRPFLVRAIAKNEGTGTFSDRYVARASTLATPPLGVRPLHLSVRR